MGGTSCCKPGMIRGYAAAPDISSPVCWDFTEPESVATKPASAAAFPDYIGVVDAVPGSLWLYNEGPGTSQPLIDATGFANLAALSSIYNGRPAVGLWGGTTFEDLIAGEYPDWLANYAAANTSIYDFDETDSFAFLTVFRFNWTAAVRGVLGKIDTLVTQGYRLETATNGSINWFVTSGVGGTVTRNAAGVHADGAWHYAICGVNRTTQLAHLFTDINDPGTASTAALGTFTNAVTFRDGRARDNTFSMPGHRLFTAAFTGAAAEALLTAGKAAADAWWATMVTKSLPNIATYTRAAPVSTQVYYRSGAQLGERVGTFAPNEVAYGWRRGFQHTTRLGLLGDPAITNLLTNSDPSLTGWTNVNASSVTAFNTNPASVPAALDNPRGSRWGVQITRTSAGGNRYATVALTNNVVYTFSVSLSNQNASFVPRLRITDAATGAVVLATEVCPVFPTTEWKRCSITFTANATASFRFEIHPDDPANAGGVVYAVDAQVEANNFASPFIPALGAAGVGANIDIQTTAIADPERGAVYADAVIDGIRTGLNAHVIDSPITTTNDRRLIMISSASLLDKAVNDSAGVAVAAPVNTLLAAPPSSHYEQALTWYARPSGDTVGIDYAGTLQAYGSTAFVSGTALQNLLFLRANASFSTVGCLANACLYDRFLSSSQLAITAGDVLYPATDVAFAAATGVTPSSIWLCDEASGGTTLADAVGAVTLTRSAGTITRIGGPNNGGTAVDAAAGGTVAYQAAVNTTYNLGAATSALLYLVCKSRNKTDTNANVMGKANAAGNQEGYYLQIDGGNQGRIRAQIKDATTLYTAEVTGYDFRDTLYHPIAMLIDRGADLLSIAADIMNTGTQSIAGAGDIDNAGLFALAAFVANTVGVDIAYAAVATGAQVEGLDLKDFLRNLGWLVEGV